MFTKMERENNMNNQEADILNILMKKNYDNQRILSEISGHSLGIVNRSIKNLTEEGYLSKDMKLTHKAKDEVKESLLRMR